MLYYLQGSVEGSRASDRMRRAREDKLGRVVLFPFCSLLQHEPCEVKRGPKPCLVEATLTTWMDECADQMVCPTLSEIRDEAQAMADKKTSVQNATLPCKFGKTWWKPLKRRNSAFVLRLAQNVESQFWGVEVVVFPPHLTDVIQPLDKAVFRGMKASFRK